MDVKVDKRQQNKNQTAIKLDNSQVTNEKEISSFQINQFKNSKQAHINQNLTTEYVQNIQNIQIINKPQQPKKSHLSYRPDIDGLRAIAVSLVIIFHAWPQTLTGGFVGVDVFFVISGFLITSIIIKQKKFSFFDFYNRRIKRIFPATITVLLFMLLFIHFQLEDLTTNSLQQTINTIQTSTYFGTNIYLLYRRYGYFDQSIKTDAALHLWSLSVQEQFYFIWPILLIVLNKCNSKFIFISGLTAFTMFSFFFNLFYSRKDPTFNYYFPLCRFWEMAMGGLLSVINLNLNSKLLTNFLGFFGLFSILFSAFYINEADYYPGYIGLIPTIGTVALIIAGKNSIINYYVLSTRVFTFIGKISFPMYLWHWPLLVFARIIYKNLQDYQILIIIFLVLSLSKLTYEYIEQNIRHMKHKKVSFGLIIIFVCIFILCLSKSVQFIQTPQFIQKMLPKQEDYYLSQNKTSIPNNCVNENRNISTLKQLKFSTRTDYFYDNNVKNVDPYSKFYLLLDKNLRLSSINFGQKRKNNLFIVGDSHAGMLDWRFSHLYDISIIQNKTHHFPNIIIATYPGSPPSPSLFYNFVMDYIKNHKPNRVFFAYRWLLYLKDKSADNQPLSLQKFKKKYQKIVSSLQKGVQRGGGKIVDFSVNQCYKNRCQRFMPNGYPIFFDSNHYLKYFCKYWLSSLDFLTQFQ